MSFIQRGIVITLSHQVAVGSHADKRSIMKEEYLVCGRNRRKVMGNSDDGFTVHQTSHRRQDPTRCFSI